MKLSTHEIGGQRSHTIGGDYHNHQHCFKRREKEERERVNKEERDMNKKLVKNLESYI